MGGRPGRVGRTPRAAWSGAAVPADPGSHWPAGDGRHADSQPAGPAPNERSAWLRVVALGRAGPCRAALTGVRAGKAQPHRRRGLAWSRYATASGSTAP